MPYVNVNVTVHEAASGTITIRAQADYADEARIRRRFTGCESLMQAKAWLREHAPNGWFWNYPDGSRVPVRITGR